MLNTHHGYEGCTSAVFSHHTFVRMVYSGKLKDYYVYAVMLFERLAQSPDLRDASLDFLVAGPSL